MRIRELNLEAYGPFEGERLVFDTGSHGFHVVYGPNEAGKSSALRAIESLLFGIETKTDDNFRHEYKKLRISAELEGAEPLFVRRRKGREKTLLDAEDRELDPTRLDRMLGGVTRELFRDLWGLSYATLRAGAEGLLQQQGNLTSALFQSGGLSHLNDLLKGLDAESRELYRPQGKCVFRTLSETHKASRQRLASSSITGSQYDRVRKAEESERQNRDARELEFQQIQADLSRLERIKNAAPTVQQYLAASRRLAELGPLPELPAGSRSKRIDLEGQISIAAKLADAARGRAEEERAAIGRLPVDEAVLLHRDAILEMAARAVRVREATRQSESELGPFVAAKTEELRRAIAAYGLGVSLERIETDLPDLRFRSRIRALGAAYEKSLLELEARRENVGSVRREVARLEAEWSALPPDVSTDRLVAAIESARALGDVEERLRKLRTENARQRGALDDRLIALSPSVPTWSALAQAPAPNEVAVAASKGRAEAAGMLLKEADAALRREEAELNKARSELRMLESSGRVLQRSDLESARSERDALFSRLREHWVEASDTEIDLYRSKLEAADRIGDELARDADRVATAARLRVGIESLAERIASLTDARDRAEREVAVASQEWIALWSPADIVPLTHDAMERWRLERESLLSDHQNLARTESEADEMEGRVQAALAALTDAGEETGSLAAVLASAVKTADRLASEKTRREEIGKKLQAERARLGDAEAALKACEQARDLAEGAWREAASAFGADATWAEVREALDGLGVIDAAVRARADALSAIELAKAEAYRFAHDSKRLGEAVGESEVDPAQLVGKLEGRLHAAETAAAERGQRQARMESEIGEEQRYRKAEGEARAQIEALLLLAGASDLDDLDRIERLCEERDRHVGSRVVAEETLAAFVGGGDMEAFIQEVDGEDVDTLPSRISILEARLESARKSANEAREAWKEANLKLEAMQGADDAAEAASDMESAAAGMAGAFERFATLRAAYHVIRAVADRYREENQGPILQKAGERLAVLTGDDFTNLEAKVGDSDQVELFAVRGDGSRVSVPGMSEGTRDSLFLALRLASLEERVARTPPLPLILDDVLIHLDDRRTGFALRALADFSKNAQVVLFTHHRHIVDLAAEAVPDRFQRMEMMGANLASHPAG